MKTATKVFIIIAICLVVTGSVIFSIAGAVINYDFTQIDNINVTYESVTRDFSVSEFTEMNINFKNVRLEFAKSGDDKIHVKYYDSSKWENNFETSKNTMTMTRRLTSWFNVDFGTTNNDIVIVELPNGYDVPMNVSVSNGYFEVDGFNFTKALDFTVYNGRLIIENSSFVDAKLTTTNGELSVESSIISGKADLNEANGQIRLEDSIFNILKADSTNGRISLDSVTFADADLFCANGRIVGSVMGKKSEFNIKTSSQNGSTNLSDQSGSTQKKLVVKTNNGSISIMFELD